MSVVLFARLDDAGRSSLAQLDTGRCGGTESGKNGSGKSLNKIVIGPSVYDAAAFKSAEVPSEMKSSGKKNPDGKELARLNRM